MPDRAWIEMPAVGTGAADDPVRPKYSVRGSALLMHKDGKVYVMCADARAQEDALTAEDCRRLTPAEGHAFEQSLPVPLPPQLFPESYRDGHRPVGLGDVVSWLTRRAGFTECSACRQRRRWLNRIVIWGWWRR